MMYKKDKIKAIAAIGIFAVIGIVYLLSGHGTTLKVAVISGTIIWLGVMFYVNRIKD